jgi:hypothetical protein
MLHVILAVNMSLLILLPYELNFSFPIIPYFRLEWTLCLRRRSWPLGYWDRGFESRSKHLRLSSSLCVLLFCGGTGMAWGWSLILGVQLNFGLIRNFSAGTDHRTYCIKHDDDDHISCTYGTDFGCERTAVEGSNEGSWEAECSVLYIITSPVNTAFL